MLGGPGNDFIVGSYGDDDIYGGEGDDIIYGNLPNTITYGTDYIEGGPGDDFIAGVDVGSGDDAVIKGGPGNDVIGAGTPIPAEVAELYGLIAPFDFEIQADGESVTNQERIFLYGDDGDDVISGAYGLFS